MFLSSVVNPALDPECDDNTRAGKCDKCGGEYEWDCYYEKPQVRDLSVTLKGDSGTLGDYHIGELCPLCWGKLNTAIGGVVFDFLDIEQAS